MALALYRKYRPARLADVVGQEHVTDPLATALTAGRVNHAYLFSGPRGCGKTSSARILARSLNCERGPTPDPCGECESCVALAPEGPGSIDVVELDAASHGGVEDARELRDRAFYAPAESRYRVFIVDEAHMVTTQGFNALLKIVEEPPDHLVFVFATTEPDKVLPTIRSRTHHYPFRLIPPGTMRSLLERICHDEEVAVAPPVFPLVIRAGGGSARDTLSVLDQLLAGAGDAGVTYERAVALLGVTDAALIDDTVDALAAGDGAAVYQAVDRLVEAGHDPRRFASDLLQRLRDLMLVQAVPEAAARGLVDGAEDELTRMADQASRLGPATLARYGEIVHNGLIEMRGATAPRLLLELLCARMLLPAATTSDAGLLERLERIERRNAIAPEPVEDGGQPGRQQFVRASRRPAGDGAGAGGAGPAGGTGSAGGDGPAGGAAVGRSGASDGSDPSDASGAADTSGGSGPAGAPAAGAASGRENRSPGRRMSAPDRPAAAGADAPGAGADGPGAGADASGRSTAGAGAAAPDRAERAASAENRLPGKRNSAPDQPETPAGTVARGRPGAESGEAAPDQPEAAAAATAPEGPTPTPPPGSAPTPPPGPESHGGPDRSPALTGSAAPAGSAASTGSGAPVGSAAPAGGDGSEPADPEPRPPRDGAPMDAAPPSSAQPASSTASLDATAVRRVWSEILAAARQRSRSTEALLVNATVRAVDGDTLVLAIGSPPLARRLSEPRNTDVIADALRAVLGVRWQVRCDQGDGPSPSRAAPARTESRPRSTPSRPAQRDPGDDGDDRPSRPAEPDPGGPAPGGPAPEHSAPDGKPGGKPDPPARRGRAAVPQRGSRGAGRSGADGAGIPLPPEPPPEDAPPDVEDEEAMIAEAAADSASGGTTSRRDPVDAAMDLLTSELGARTIDRG